MSLKEEDKNYMTNQPIKDNVGSWLGPQDTKSLATASKYSGLRLNSIKCKEITNTFGGQSSEVIGQEIIRLLQDGKRVHLGIFLGWLKQSHIVLPGGIEEIEDYDPAFHQDLLDELNGTRRMSDLELLFHRFDIQREERGDEAFKVQFFMILLYAIYECVPSDLTMGGKRKRSRKKRKIRRKSKKNRKTRRSYRR